MRSGELKPQSNIIMSQNDITEIGSKELKGSDILGRATSNTITFLTSMTRNDMQDLINAQEKYIERGHVLLFDFEAGTHDLGSAAGLYFDGFCGPGTLRIGDPDGSVSVNTTQTSILNYTGGSHAITVAHCQCHADIRSIKITPVTTSIAGIQVIRSASFVIRGCYVQGNGTAGCRGYYVVNSSGGIQTSSVNNVRWGIRVEQASLVTSNTNPSIGTNPLYGLYCEGVIIHKTSTQPTGSTANEWVTNGGIIR